MSAARSSPTADLPKDAGGIVVGMGDPGEAPKLLDAAFALAKPLNATVEAVHVETPSAADSTADPLFAAALAAAQARGAVVATVPASSVAEGLAESLRAADASCLVIGHGRSRSRLSRRLLADEVIGICESAWVLVVPRGSDRPRPAPRLMSWRSVPADYAVALAGVAATAALAAVLRQTTSVISTSILFLFPVIAAAARSGLGPTLFSVAVAVVVHNLLFLEPRFSLDLLAAQSWIMAAGLLVAGVYTSAVTSSLRGRVRLSDRSARESARIAAFAQRLTRLADWQSTGAAVCEEIATFLDADTVIFREVDGQLVKVADYPRDVVLEPVDEVALHWAWERGAGSAEALASGASQPGNWEFHALATSLGVLAVIGLSRRDGRAPVNAHQAVLFSTLIAQAALAHERLRLEDTMHAR